MIGKSGRFSRLVWQADFQGLVVLRGRGDRKIQGQGCYERKGRIRDRWLEKIRHGDSGEAVSEWMTVRFEYNDRDESLKRESQFQLQAFFSARKYKL